MLQQLLHSEARTGKRLPYLQKVYQKTIVTFLIVCCFHLQKTGRLILISVSGETLLDLSYSAEQVIKTILCKPAGQHKHVSLVQLELIELQMLHPNSCLHRLLVTCLSSLKPTEQLDHVLEELHGLLVLLHLVPAQWHYFILSEYPG